MAVDHFAQKAARYEDNPSRVDNVATIAEAILRRFAFRPAMHLIDFGSDTGLLLEKIAPYVDRITAIDVSPAMNRQLADKRSRIACELELLEVDLEKTTLPLRVDGIISSMTMHHIADTAAMFAKFHAMLRDGGFIAIADLDCEDGSFHSEDTGVFHHGFEREAFAKLPADAGFASVRLDSVSVLRKPQGEYGVFLLSARRPGPDLANAQR
ncbi:Methyltransferase domain-containing protein [Solimonas aquatica]|uniref:Methyltransferase domain-containing protein n=1 Tax=Solimonas aquatica TaxID=489703 RepID=A0A1H9CG15_9GAMM|nr:methyltransferase domain-containing protein [Solimonas aquatica]SEQ00102.1 Methyltransferase domain-containing protein [Solimonas aquatica]